MGEVAPEGMALRDYFAAKAMQGFMANKSNPMHYQPETDAQWAYMIADAMLKARET
jgi:beta-N-acetylglucosaminidase